MQDFKNFIIRLQTINIKINQRGGAGNSGKGREKFYDISHENPFLSTFFQNELKELKELAVTDILNLPREQLLLQLQRLNGLKEIFDKFWYNLYHSPIDRRTDILGYFSSLNLNDIFISPHLYFADHAIADENLIEDLTDSIRARENILKEFEEAVSKVINLRKETEKSASSKLAQKEVKAGPVFRQEVIPEFFTIMKSYFSPPDQDLLLKLLTTNKDADEPLLFNGPGNQLADAFKQLYISNLITSCNKSELESWIQTNFQYRDKGVYKHYSEKYLQDIISTNTKGCQSPLFDVKKSEGQFYLSVLHRNNKNQKR